MKPIRLAGVSKAYLGSTVLSDVSVGLPPGSLSLVSGPSGSGKTTLLNLMSGIDTPDSGQIEVGSLDLISASRRRLEQFRATNGYVFQRSGLIGGLTIRENIDVGHALSRQSVDPSWVAHLLDRLGIAAIHDQRASSVSGGQAQRAAIVRCLAHRPPVVFADEPTASLDFESKTQVLSLLREIADSEGTTIVLVSHDEHSREFAHRRLQLLDGRVKE